MSKLVWDVAGQHLFETGVDRGVLYDYSSSGTPHVYGTAHAWNGLTAFNESPDGGDANDIYADNIKYLSLRGTENFKFSIEAYTYPDAFCKYNGESLLLDNKLVITNQGRPTFGFSCRTKVGDDANGSDRGYKYHLCYGVTCSPSDRSYETINDSPDAINFSWDCETVPYPQFTSGGKTFKPTAHVIIDCTKLTAAQITTLETALHGDATHNAYLPTPEELMSLWS